MVHGKNESNMEKREATLGSLIPWFRVLQCWRGEYHKGTKDLQRSSFMAGYTPVSGKRDR